MPREATLSGGETDVTQCDDFYGIVHSYRTGSQHKLNYARDPLISYPPNTCILGKMFIQVSAVLLPILFRGFVSLPSIMMEGLQQLL